MAPEIDPEKQRITDEIAGLMARLLDPDLPEQDAEMARNLLVEKYAAPLIAKIVGFKVKANPLDFSTEREAIASYSYVDAVTAMCRIMDRWRESRIGLLNLSEEASMGLRPHGGGYAKEVRVPLPENFLDYVAIVAYNQCKHAFASLRGTEVFALLTYTKGLEVWTNADHMRVGGYAVWRDSGRPEASPAILDAMDRAPKEFAKTGQEMCDQNKSLANSNPLERLKALLDRADGPVELNALVSAFVALEPLSIQEVSAGVPGSGDDRRDTLEDKRKADTDVEGGVIEAEAAYEILRKLWPRIIRLPDHHQAALLLKWEAEVVSFLLDTEIVSREEFSRAVGVIPEALAGLLGQLPLEDAVIAQRLHRTEQQVRTCRNKARETLARHIRPFGRDILRHFWNAAIALEPPRPAVLMLYARDSTSGASLLSLLVSENIEKISVIAVRLSLPEKEIKRLWKDLPLRLDQIAGMLGKTPHETTGLYNEAVEQLKDVLEGTGGDRRL